MELSTIISEYAIEYMGDIYFTTYGGNSFYRYNREKNESYKIGPVIKAPVSGSVSTRLYKKICPIERKVYLFPWNADSKIDIFDLNTESLTQIDISMFDLRQDGKENFKFCDCIVFGKYIYAIGFSYPAVLRVDTESDDINIVVDFRNELDTEKSHLYLGYGARSDNIIYVPLSVV